MRTKLDKDKRLQRLLRCKYYQETNRSRRRLILKAWSLMAMRDASFHETMKTVPSFGDHLLEFAEWLFYEVTPSEMRAMAGLLTLKATKTDSYRLAVLDAYMIALEESDPGIYERAFTDVGLERVAAHVGTFMANPVDFVF